LRECSNIFQDFNEATHSISFFIYVIRRNNDVEDISISLENDKTNEKLVIKTNVDDGEWKTWKLMIARYPRNAPKNWIEAKEKEIAEWNGGKLDRKISVLFAI
jgi:predicted PolB exonuclease-like 3'-5' exonuclease